MEKRIVIEIGPDGSVSAEAFGYVGRACDLDMALVHALGPQVERRNKPEYYSREKEGSREVAR